MEKEDDKSELKKLEQSLDKTDEGIKRLWNAFLDGGPNKVDAEATLAFLENQEDRRKQKAKQLAQIMELEAASPLPYPRDPSVQEKLEANVGFRCYTTPDGTPIIPDPQMKAKFEATKRYAVNTDNIKYFTKKPKPKPTFWQEAKDRLVRAWNILKHGKEYYE
jgi:hypothetical protein